MKAVLYLQEEHLGVIDTASVSKPVTSRVSVAAPVVLLAKRHADGSKMLAQMNPRGLAPCLDGPPP
jgi:hypothetical protein